MMNAESGSDRGPAEPPPAAGQHVLEMRVRELERLVERLRACSRPSQPDDLPDRAGPRTGPFE